MFNKKGAVTGGTVLIVVLVLVGAYIFVPSVQEAVGGILGEGKTVDKPTDNCPSSGLTEVTLNTVEALASTATNANTTYYVYDNGKMIKSGETGTDGTVSFDLECGAGKRYTMFVNNDLVADGFYGQKVTVDATGVVDIHNLEMYQFGEIGIGSIVASQSPNGNESIEVGAGKNCGFKISYTANESAAAFNKPIFMILVNSTGITDVTITGATEVLNKPSRLSPNSGFIYYAFEVDEMILSTDSGRTLSGQLLFATSPTPPVALSNNLTVMAIDQVAYMKASYKTLSFDEGFVVAAENQESLAEIGGIDSNKKTLYFNGDAC